ncbi:hypothetical protein [Stenotrophomonas sp. ZAC14D2_NAIMI4_6]|uniref:hypothetical protein n=1 Tax=Stenotrophomonas sp. ZAC14D2_NAIMI4_6 TaxID=2072406 RepID=UPI00131ED368|nr:hypothetical protein [Stenotrophomonas sp. ZAC14D2_NAIMI4_6]
MRRIVSGGFSVQAVTSSVHLGASKWEVSYSAMDRKPRGASTQDCYHMRMMRIYTKPASEQSRSVSDDGNDDCGSKAEAGFHH